MKTLTYKIVSFFLENWKGTIKLILAIYFITMGISLLAGNAAGFAMPMLNMTLPSV